MSNDLVTIRAVILEPETELAIMVKNLEGRDVWLPKSKISIDGDEIELPEWLAEEKDLI